MHKSFYGAGQRIPLNPSPSQISIPSIVPQYGQDFHLIVTRACKSMTFGFCCRSMTFPLVVWSIGVFFEPFAFPFSVEHSPVVTRFSVLQNNEACQSARHYGSPASLHCSWCPGFSCGPGAYALGMHTSRRILVLPAVLQF